MVRLACSRTRSSPHTPSGDSAHSFVLSGVRISSTGVRARAKRSFPPRGVPLHPSVTKTLRSPKRLRVTRPASLPGSPPPPKGHPAPAPTPARRQRAWRHAPASRAAEGTRHLRRALPREPQQRGDLLLHRVPLGLGVAGLLDRRLNPASDRRRVVRGPFSQIALKKSRKGTQALKSARFAPGRQRLTDLAL